MPYQTTKDLPPATAQLPEAAKSIFLGAFNGAWEEYADAEDREQRAHATAWAAVKAKYVKRNGRWKLKDKTNTAEVAEAGTGGTPMAAMMKNENGVDYPAADFAYVPNPKAPGSWKLRMTEKPGEVTRAQLGRACEALSPGGFRGQPAMIPEKDMPMVKRTLRAAYAKLGVEKKDLPDAIKEAAERAAGPFAGLQMMTLAEEPIEGDGLTEQPMPGMPMGQGNPEDANAAVAEPGASTDYAQNAAQRKSAEGKAEVDLYPFFDDLQKTLNAIAASPAKGRKALLQPCMDAFSAAVIAHLSTPRIMEALLAAQEGEAPTLTEAYSEECLEVEGGEVAPDLAEAEITGPPKPIIATLIKAGLNKAETREYTPTFLRRCISEGRFTGSYCHVDHPTQEQQRQRPERSMRTIAARTGEAFWDESVRPLGAVRAPIVWLNADRPGTPGYEAEGLFRDPIVRQRSGLSIFYMGPVDVEEVARPEVQGRKVKVPKALGDSRKFDVDLVTSPGAGGGLPLHESDVPEEEPMMETLDELKAQYPGLVAQLREEWEAEQPPAEEAPAEDVPVVEAAAPAPETVPEAVPEPEPEPVAESEVVVAPKTADPVIEELRAKIARLESGRMLDEFLAREPVDQTIREAARAALADDVFTDEATFRAKARVVVDGLKEVASKAAGPRVAGLGGTSPAEGEQKFTLGDLTQKKEAK